MEFKTMYTEWNLGMEPGVQLWLIPRPNTGMRHSPDLPLWVQPAPEWSWTPPWRQRWDVPAPTLPLPRSSAVSWYRRDPGEVETQTCCMTWSPRTASNKQLSLKHTQKQNKFLWKIKEDLVTACHPSKKKQGEIPIPILSVTSRTDIRFQVLFT